jgi:hypothetical protein
MLAEEDMHALGPAQAMEQPLLFMFVVVVLMRGMLTEAADGFLSDKTAVVYTK